MTSLSFVMESSARFIWYVTVFALVGVVALRWVVLPPVRTQRANPAEIDDLQRKLVRTGMVMASVLCLVSMLRLWLQTYAFFGGDEGVSAETLRIIVTETPWGHGWIWQLVAGALALVVFLTASRRPELGWALTIPVTLIVVVTLPLTGHAMSMAPSAYLGVAMQSIHVLAAAVWIGTLGLLYIFVVSKSRDDAELAPGLVHRFSPVAVGAVGTLFVAGLLTAITYLNSWNQLFSTTYGRVLLSKILIFGATGVTGLYNWKVIRPRLHTRDGAAKLRRTVVLELAWAAVVLSLTAFLVGTSMED